MSIYDPRKKKVSQFIKGASIDNNVAYSSIQGGVNKTFTQAQILADVADVYGASLRTFEFESELVASDIALGEYAIVEENQYAFYKVTNDAATGENVGLTSGLTASLEMYLIRNTYATVAALKLKNLESGILVNTQGYYSVGDGGAAHYTIKTAAQAATDGDIIDTYGNHTLANGNVAILTTGSHVLPEQFGSTGDGTTLESAVWAPMVAQAIRLGVPVFGNPNKTYLLSDTTSGVDQDMYDLGACQYFKFDGRGCTLKSTVDLTNNTNNWFVATDGNNITLENFVLDTPFLQDGELDPRGVQLFLGFDKCQNVTIRNITGPGGVMGIAAFERSDTGSYLDYEDQAKRILIENIDLTTINYCGNFRFNGSDAVGRNLKFGFVHRSWYLYGVQNHDIQVTLYDFDAAGVLFACFEGQSISNVKVDLTVPSIANSRLAAVLLGFYYAPGAPGSIINVNVNLNCDLSNNVGNGVLIRLDGVTTGGFNVLKDLVIAGRRLVNIQGRCFTYTELDGATIANELQTNSHRIKNLELEQTSGSVWPVSNSISGFFMDNVSLDGSSNKNFEFVAAGTTYNNTINFKSVIGGSIHASGGDTATVKFEDCILSSSSGQDYKNSLYANTDITGVGLLNKADKKYVVPADGSKHNQDLIGFGFTSQVAANPISATITKDTNIYPDLLPTSTHQPKTYMFSIGVKWGSNIGVFFGNVVLRSDGTDIIFAQLSAGIECINISGAEYLASQLAVSLSSGSPVFTVNHTVELIEVDIREP